MDNNLGFQTLGDIFQAKEKNKKPTIKPPAHQWQDFALQIIKALSIPNFKRNSVFKICKDYPRAYVEGCVADTKELCQSGEKWKYFFKVISDQKDNPSTPLKVDKDETKSEQTKKSPQ
ncbi:hypothetical protein HOD19_01385 [bacterium]|jgi:hypothetical protein|nr:hypothetical protein [bacterium]MBT4649249.1 hypothetical protein [bacterium]